MKKQKIPILALITCIFLGFLLGFFAGRNLNRTPVQIQSVPAATGTTAPVEEPTQEVQTFPININTATVQELQALPGIGATYAQRIIDYRNAWGPFTSPAQLLNVSGIGQKRLEAIWDFITIGD